MRTVLSLLFAATALCAAPPATTPLPPRTWTSSDGKSSFEGSLLEFSETEVRIRRRSDFNQFKLPLEKLSAADQEHVRGLLRERRRDKGLTDGSYAAKITGKFEKGISKQGLNFQIWGNPKFEPTQRYPMVVWLHGAGQSGNDNEAQMGGAPKSWTSEPAQKLRPCFMLAPQCPSRETGWREQVADQVMALIADLCDHLPVDEKRIYLTGSSMGGSGSWHMAAKHPQAFAAVVPLCGGGDPKNAEVLKAIPIWVFHGDNDDQVPVDRSRTMVEAIKKAGGTLINYSELAGEGHLITSIVYPRVDLAEWVFKQAKERPE